MRIPQATRNAMAETMRLLIDGGGSAGTIKFYSGLMPDHAWDELTNQTLLATLTFAHPCAETPVGGILDFLPIAEDPEVPASGIVSWARIADGDGNTILDLDVTGPNEGGMIEINTTNICKGGPFRLRDFGINFPGKSDKQARRIMLRPRGTQGIEGNTLELRKGGPVTMFSSLNFRELDRDDGQEHRHAQ